MSDARAWRIHALGEPLQLDTVPVPEPGAGDLLIRVSACAVCRTDLHILDGELREARYPIVPGHQVVGRVEALGADVSDWSVGERAGVPWLGWACGVCEQCRAGRENLCPKAEFTGYHRDGGFADYMTADARFCLRIPDAFDDAHAAPLLCGGLIGYRALRMAGDAHRIGFYGFGSAAHMIAQVARHQGREVYAFTRPGDTQAQRFAKSLGATWAGPSDEPAPAALDAALIFAPVGALVPAALRAVRDGGTVVCAGIHMSDIPSFPYRILWGERVLRSVANLTRADGAFLEAAAEAGLETSVRTFPLDQAPQALEALRAGILSGTAVLTNN